MAYDIFLKIKGITGDSKDTKHKDWIEVQSYRHDIHDPYGGAINAGDESYTGHGASHFDFEIVKKLDAASPMLFRYCHHAKLIQQVELEVCRAMGDKTPFMKYTFRKAVITQVLAEAEGDDINTLPLEKIKLRYAQIELEYTQTTPEGGAKKGASIQVSINLRQ